MDGELKVKLKFELLSPINGESVHVIDEQIVNYLNEANKNLDLANINLIQIKRLNQQEYIFLNQKILKKSKL